MKRVFALIAALAMLLSAATSAELSIVTTDFPCYDFARAVCGDRASVTMLLKPGTEAHSYDPTPADILAIGDADLFVCIGGESDAWAEGILAGFDGEGPAVLRMMDCVEDLVEEEDEDHAHGEEGPEYDEHIWTSPVNAARMVRALGDALSGIDPDGSDLYRDNAENYAEAILSLDGEIRGIVEGAARRTLVFADRFPFVYFTREYGLDALAAFPSCTADTEPSAQIVLKLIQKVTSEAIPAVYTIELSNQTLARTVSEETGAKVLTLHSMQTVSQADFDAGETYLTLMSRNIQALREGLE